MNKLTAEFTGTFFVSLVALLTGSAIATAGTLAALLYALNYISGGHFNPAISLAVWMRGQMDRRDFLRYAAAQAGGALAAALICHLLAHKTPVPAPTFPWFRALLGETLFTFLVAFIYLHVRTARQVMGNTWFGTAVGLAHFAGATALAPLSGGACNPALGLAFVVSGQAAGPWMILIHLTAALTAGAAAAITYRLLNPND